MLGDEGCNRMLFRLQKLVTLPLRYQVYVTYMDTYC